MSNIVKNYYRVLEVISSLNWEYEHKSKVGRKSKMSDIEVVALSLTSEYMSIDSENSLFKQIKPSEIPNLIERSQFNKRRRKLFFFLNKIRLKLASSFIEFEKYFIVDSMPLEICKFSRHNRIKICKGCGQPWWRNRRERRGTGLVLEFGGWWLVVGGRWSERADCVATCWATLAIYMWRLLRDSKNQQLTTIN